MVTRLANERGEIINERIPPTRKNTKREERMGDGWQIT
jgi:hypothetical protein